MVRGAISKAMVLLLWDGRLIRKNYYLRWSDGSMATGWHHEGAKHLYLQSDGSLYVGKGWTKFGDRWFYYADAAEWSGEGWLAEGEREMVLPVSRQWRHGHGLGEGDDELDTP